MSNNSSKSEDNLFVFLVNKYLPFWPLFVGLLSLGLLLAWAYLRYIAIPVYEASATIIVKDTKKGVEESRMTRSMDAFIANNIVENEIKIMQSRASVQKVVKELYLYAPVFEEGRYKLMSAYTSSPIKIAHRHPETLREFQKIYFSYDPAARQVLIGQNRYPLSRWVRTPYGELQFIPNDKKSKAAKNPLYFSLLNLKKATNSLAAKLSIQTENKLSTAVNLSMKDQVPERAEDVLNHLLDAYAQVGIENRNKLAAKTLEFVEDRLRLVGQELEMLEKKVVEYKATQGVVNLSEQGKVFLNNVGASDRELSEIDLQLAVLREVNNLMESGNLGGTLAPSTLGIKDPVLAQLVKSLYEAESEYQRLKPITAENNPILLALQDEIRQMRLRIKENVRNQQVALQTSRSKLTATRNEYNQALLTIPQKERELLDMTRQQTSKNEAYQFLLQKREEAMLSLAPSAEDTNFVDVAEASMSPVSPQPMYLYLIALVAACACGVALVSGRELLSSRILFRSEIQDSTSIPIVAELSHVKQNQSKTFTAPTAAFIIEQFRQMRVTLGLYGRFFIKKKIVVTSNIPGEGKSFVSTHLAFSLASSGKRVVLLDFDLRNPHTSRLFNLNRQRGITEYLTAEATPEEIINNSPFENLYLVPAGLQIGDNTELLLNGKLESFFAYLENEFDYLIMDTPPIDLVTDAYLLSEYCDISLLVMRHGHTPKRIVQRLDQNKKLQSMNNLSIVFNGVKSRGFVQKHYGYGYGYGHQNNYGAKMYAAPDLKRSKTT